MLRLPLLTAISLLVASLLTLVTLIPSAPQSAQTSFRGATFLKSGASTVPAGITLRDIFDAENIVGSYATGEARQQLLQIVLAMRSSLRHRLTSKTKLILLYDYGTYTVTFANMPGLERTWAKFKHLTGNYYQAPDGTVRWVLPLLPQPAQNRGFRALTQMQPYYNVGPNHGHGPYRRVFTDNGSSYTDENAWVTLPCTQSLDLSNESGQAYMGGWGGGATSGALDAGLETPKGGGNWGPYINLEGVGYTGTLIRKNNPPSSWPCTTPVWMDLWITRCPNCGDGQNHLWLYLTTQDQYGNALIVSEILCKLNNGSSAPFPYLGWDDKCNGCVLKRATSVAQNSENMYSKAILGTAQWRAALLNGSTRWDASHSGGCDEYFGWYGDAEGDCLSGPPAGAINMNWTVNWHDYADEDDSVSLDPTNPISGSSTSQKYYELCVSSDPPFTKTAAYFYDSPFSAPTSYKTPATTKAPVSSATAIALGISTTYGGAQIALFGPAGQQLGTTTISGAGQSGQLIYYNNAASAGAYTFEVQGQYSTGDPGCSTPRAVGSVSGTSWVGNLQWH